MRLIITIKKDVSANGIVLEKGDVLEFFDKKLFLLSDSFKKENKKVDLTKYKKRLEEALFDKMEIQVKNSSFKKKEEIIENFSISGVRK